MGKRLHYASTPRGLCHCSNSAHAVDSLPKGTNSNPLMKSAVSDVEFVQNLRPSRKAICGGRFQIFDVASGAVLSTPCASEVDAWKVAADRLRREQALKRAAPKNRRTVLKAYPDAYCSCTRLRFQIRRPRAPIDTPSVVKYVALSSYFTMQISLGNMLPIGSESSDFSVALAG